MNASLLDARTAADRLKVSRATLYAYVSRGLIRTHAHPDNPRARLYAAIDIEALKRRKSLQHKPAEAAAGALDWGMPALETSISNIENGRLTYRGTDAIALADTAGFEDIAALLWQYDVLAETRFLADESEAWANVAHSLAGATGLVRAMALLPLLGVNGSFEQSAERLAARGAVLVRALAEAVAPGLAPGLPVHLALANRWQRPTAADAIRRALVLVADHEMNTSTFAVRVVASTGARLVNCLVAGLAALSGPLHGGATARSSALFREADMTGDATGVVGDRLARGDELPGFGHRLYPDGDPRAKALLAALDAPRETAIIAAVAAQTGLHPNIDTALSALERAFDLPEGAALDLFTIGRSAGWVAHAIEQRLTGPLIRPRARFVGAGVQSMRSD